MTNNLPHDSFNAVILAATFRELFGHEVVCGRVFDDREMRFDDGINIYTSYILEKHWVSEGEWVVRTRNSLYHVFETGFKGSAEMPVVFDSK